MAVTLAFFADPGLTSRIDRLRLSQGEDGSGPVVDRVVYLGSPVPGRRFRDHGAPGTAAITVSLADAGSGGSVPATALRLSATAGGLDAATPGAAIEVGTAILSGPAGAVPVHLRIQAPALASGRHTNLSLAFSTVEEAAI